MPDTFIKIASVTVGSGGASSIDFTSIPSTYTDLCVKFSARVNVLSDQTWITLNSSTTGFSNKVLYGSGSAAASTSVARFIGYHDRSDTTANTFGSAEFYIPNYAGSNYKSISSDSVWENNGTNAYQALSASLWSNTGAITSISLTPESGSYVQYSTATLYGIKNS